MEIKRGTVARSAAGRDKGSFCTVLSLAGSYALVSDGKRRTLEKPKKKKLIHLFPTRTILPEEALHSNRALRAALRPFCGKGSSTPEEADL
ncbi:MULTISPECIES: KOW domain-containing RNA-binding protein [Caproicibacterium]|uniref:KOW domain-containing RNA-binding protein n=1 Tax=Caproicibacterium argilliputei TaxID=3030016 RepID=A0AA97D9A1_9FIRM|nr:KOW domain-containing RNA-binding protein [Caproicibacterium argilliputei]WOC32606.1 KOW domain-containing RNA-binding protein [Caproicibacterium argilliputei]